MKKQWSLKQLRELETYAIRNAPKGHMKGLPAIRVLLFGMLVVGLFAYALILFDGGYSQTNHLPMNGTASRLYNSVNGNTVGGGIFGNITSLTQTANTTKNNFANGGLTGAVSQVLGILQIGASFLPAMFGFYWNFGLIIAGALEAIGIPAGFGLVIGEGIMLVIAVALLISIWALKDL